MPHPKEADLKRLLEAGFNALSAIFVGRTVRQTEFPWLDSEGTTTFEVSRPVFDASTVTQEINSALDTPAMTELAEMAAANTLLTLRLGRYGSGGSVAPEKNSYHLN
jgi:hypothetical protein